MKKRIFALFLTLLMVLPTVSVSAADRFGDIAGSYGKSAIERWSDAGIVNGVGNGSYDPDGCLTRAQAAAIISKLLKLTAVADMSNYPDMADGAWYADAIGKCAAAGIMSGDGERMDPDGYVSREMFCTILGRALFIPTETDNDPEYADANLISEWAKGYVASFVSRGYLKGVGGNRLAPGKRITRASVAVLLDRIIANYINNENNIIEENGLALVVEGDFEAVKNYEGSIVILADGVSGSLDGVSDKCSLTVSADNVVLTDVPDGVRVFADEDLTNVSVNGRIIAGGETTVVKADDEAVSEKPETDEKKSSQTVAVRPVHKHRYNEEITKPATCTEDGIKEYTCRCGRSYTEAIVRLSESGAHTPASPVRENEQPASCTAEGSYDEVVKCSACGEEISRTSKTIAKAAHKYVNGVCEYCGGHEPVQVPTVCISSVEAKAGDTVNITVEIKNNPGLFGAILGFSFDSKLTLTVAESGDAFSELVMTKPGKFVSPCNFVWDGQDEPAAGNGRVLTLSFKVSETAQPDKKLDIKLSYADGDVVDSNFLTIQPKIVNGGVTVINYVPGDVNGDGVVNTVDITMLRRFRAGGYSVDINESAADVNDDDKVNTVDISLIRRFRAGGYGVTLLPHTIRCKHETLEAEAEKVPNCTEAGNISYWKCKNCGKAFADSEGATELALSDTVIAPAHTPAAPVRENEVKGSCTVPGTYDEVIKCAVCGEEISRESKRDAGASHTPGKAANCTEAQVCTLCNAIITPAAGHRPEVVPGKDPTYDESGLTDGEKCSVCGEILVEQQRIPKLQKNEVIVEYDLAGSDLYLKDLIANGELIKPETETVDTTDYSVKVKQLSKDYVSGYEFLGWYEINGVDEVTEIAKGSTGKITLCAKLKKISYNITYDSSEVSIPEGTKDKYTVDEGVPKLPDLELFGYKFIGWADDDGFIRKTIPKGTTGDITLHANWTSMRNLATSYREYDKPIIIEDGEKGQLLFVYDIGKIENVPLYLVEDLGPSEGQTVDRTWSETETITKSQANTIANAISNSTTRSSGWTLAKEWNQTYSAGSEYGDAKVKSDERTDSEGNVTGGQYFISNSKGGSSYVSNESGAESSYSSKVTTDSSASWNVTTDSETERYVDAKVGAKIGGNTSSSSKSKGLSLANMIGVEVSAEISGGIRQTDSCHVENSGSYSSGTETSSSSKNYSKCQQSETASWNSNTSYEKSYETSRDSRVTAAISEQIYKTQKYNLNDSLGGSNSQTESVAGTDTRKDEYSTTFAYSSEKSMTKTLSTKTTASPYGNYRLVTAGTVHVYGIVGYDVASSSYYVYTFNVLDDERKLMLDFSKKSSSFDDCENGLVTFTVPYEVNDYVTYFTGYTPGLEYDYDGNVIGFEPRDNFDGTVVIPTYYSMDNGDGTYSAIRTTGIDKDVFKNDTSLKQIELPLYLNNISEGAFEGCTNLKTVVSYGVTSIGRNAFKGCTSLDAFSIDNVVTYIGENSFDGVEKLNVMAANSAVAEGASKSGAKNIVVSIERAHDKAVDASGTALEMPISGVAFKVGSNVESFKLIGARKTYDNISLASDAGKTVVNGVNFANNTGVPMRISSPEVELVRSSVVNAPGFALALTSPDTLLSLSDNIKLSSKSGNTVISKNVTLKNMIAGKLSLNGGSYLVCGAVNGSKLLSSDTVTRNIDELAFESYLNPATVTFDSNGGNSVSTKLSVVYGQSYGKLPEVERENYTFAGWYTEKDGGVRVLEDTAVATLGDHKLYAHWTVNAYTVTFDPCGGSCSVASQVYELEKAYGTLPGATRNGFTFGGWYADRDYRTQIFTDSKVNLSGDTRFYAKWTPNSYTLNFAESVSAAITVKRTSSPYMKAECKPLYDGSVIYWGDVLEISYRANPGYKITSSGVTSVTVTGSVGESSIYAKTEALSYNCKIEYRSINGVLLGNTSLSGKYGETKNVDLPSYNGYNKPSGNSVVWDTAGDKTVVFVYSPSSVTPTSVSGQHYTSPKTWHSAKLEFRNRTENSIEVRLYWAETVEAGGYNAFSQHLDATVNTTALGIYKVVGYNLWGSSSSSSRTETVYTEWKTIPVAATQTTVKVYTKHWQQNYSGYDMGSSFGKDFIAAIPTY